MLSDCSNAGKIYAFNILPLSYTTTCVSGMSKDPLVHICRSNNSIIDPRYSLNISAISLFLKSISPFSFNIMPVSALLCLFEK